MTKSTESVLLTPERRDALIAAALAAPSADNRHVFRIEARGDMLHLLAKPEFAAAPMRRRVLGLMSLGAVAENLELRAACLGIRLLTQWSLDASADSVLATFECAAAGPNPDPLESAIALRHTNRRLRFRGPPLDSAGRARLAAQALAVEGSSLVWLDAPIVRRRALQLVRWAETERFRNPALHQELFESIRFDVGWSQSSAEGLPPAALELPWIERPAFAMLRHWRAQQLANWFGAHHFIGWRAAALPCRLAPHLCAITADGGIDTAAVKAGRLLQRAWLEATLLGLSFQVFAASPLYALDGLPEVGSDLRSRLAAGWRDLCGSARPLVVFRMGYAVAASCRAGRPLP